MYDSFRQEFADNRNDFSGIEMNGTVRGGVKPSRQVSVSARKVSGHSVYALSK